MRIQVSAIHFSAGDGFRTHAETRLREGIGKYTDRATDASVTVLKEGHEFQTDCSAHLASGMVAKAQGRASDAYASFEQALERLEKQLRRHKRRVTDHRPRNAESHRSA